MDTRRFASSLGTAAALVALLGASTLLTGCGMNASSANSAATAVSSQARFGGNVHGGQQAIAGATVQLWAAGVTGTGYGTTSTLVATTTTDTNGFFNFDNAGGASPCTIGQYLYVTATGGAPVGSTTNTSSALMAAIPTPCNTASATPTASQYVYINEVTTVAAVWSLQQFMTITPGAAVPWRIGAPATNVTGLANAFLMTTNLANITNGTTSTSSTSNAVSNTVGGVLYTTVINPNYAKINTLANILATCVNTSSQCSALFADTTPTGSAAPTDTVQVAYYIARNPAGLNMPQHASAVSTPAYLCSQYPSANSPFQPTLTCSGVYEYTIGVKWKTTNASNATVGTVYSASIAIDGNGYIWSGGGNGDTANFVTAFNAAGQLLVPPVTTATVPAYNLTFVTGGTTTSLANAVGTQTLSYGRPFSLAIDTNNNAWFSSYTAAPGTLTSGSTSVATGLLTEVTQTGGATGYLVGASAGSVAIDGSNNIFINDRPTAEYYLSELPASGNYQTLYAGYTGTGASIFNDVFADASGYSYGLSATTTSPDVLQRVNTTQEAAAQTGGTTAAPANSSTALSVTNNFIYYGALDSLSNIWGTSNGNLYYADSVVGGTTPVISIVSGSTNTSTGTAGGTGGLDATQGVAIDGAGTVWVVNRLSSTTSGANGVSALVPTVNAGTGNATVTALSPSAAGVYGFGSDEGFSGLMGVQIDASGNLWFNSTAGSYLNFIVGAAAPVVTPVSLQLKNSQIGVRP